MADSTVYPVLSVCATVGSKVSDLEVKNGQLIFVRDNQEVALDFDGKRTFYKQIIELATDGARTSMLAPVAGLFYFVVETAVLWTYRNGWVQITTHPADTSAFPLDTRCYFTSLALAKAAAATATEVSNTDAETIYCYGMKLLVDDGVYSKWYTIQRNGTLLEEGISFTTDDTLTMTTVILEDGTVSNVLKVNTTNEATADSKLPITSAGVYAQLGNIGALLDSI